LPYGFHPHNLAWNVVAFLGGLFLPWMITLVLALFFSMRGRRMRQLPAPIFLAAWTAFVLLLVYGSAMYADHVRPGAVTIGNSFLRYLLPLAPLIGWAAASLWQHAQRFPLGRIIALVGVIALVGLGGYRAVFGDDEALLFTRHELVRYSQIRSMSHEWFRPGDVIFSERSDKIFFPEFRAVSPLPPKEEIARLASIDSVRLGLFIRTLSQAQKDAWLEAGVDAQELASFGNERLYRLVPRSL
jgi:hypothetical protein